MTRFGSSSTIGKVGDILEALAGAGRPMTLGELALVAPLPKPTLRRLLLQLCETGLVRQDARSREYSLGHRLITLAAAVLDQMDIRRAALPFMRQLVERTGESAYLAILDSWDVVYVEVIENDKSVRIITRVGSRCPAHATATGKVLIAFQPETRRRAFLAHQLSRATANTVVDPAVLERQLDAIRATGHAATFDEAQAEVTAVAAPVFDGTGTAVAALGVGIPSHRSSDERLLALTTATKEVTAQLTNAIGGRPPGRSP